MYPCECDEHSATPAGEAMILPLLVEHFLKTSLLARWNAQAYAAVLDSYSLK